jgi:hypothetical protein
MRGVFVNNTPHAVAQAIVMDPDGRDVLVVVVKATYRWQRDGAVQAAAPLPVRELDLFAGPPASSGLIAAGELTLPKPRIDLLFEGEIALPAPAEQVDCTIEVGRRLRKSIRVVGPRVWSAGVVRDLVPSRPRPFDRMPIAWERSFGGTDPDDPSVVELSNPVGCGLRKRPASLSGQPVPNFEDPQAPVASAGARPQPMGLGPVAPHWQPRRALAGTYDEAWQQQRFPVLPTDFDRRFLNAAPADQQLPSYQPGETIRLENMSRAGRDRIVLPELAPAVAIVEGRRMLELRATVDTIIISPAEQCLSLIARAAHPLAPDDGPVSAVFVGPLSAGQQRALVTGKTYLGAAR